MKHSDSLSYYELARIYLKVGMNAFGGWSTTYLLIEKEFAEKRVLLSKDQLETALASGQALPGPAQVTIAAQTSYYLKGVSGSLLATFCYLLPSVTATLAFSFVYFTYLSKNDVGNYTIGIQAAVSGILIGNAFKIGKRTATSSKLWALAIVGGAVYYFTNLPTMIIIFAFGAAGVIAGIVKQRGKRA